MEKLKYLNLSFHFGRGHNHDIFIDLSSHFTQHPILRGYYYFEIRINLHFHPGLNINLLSVIQLASQSERWKDRTMRTDKILGKHFRGRNRIIELRFPMAMP